MDEVGYAELAAHLEALDQSQADLRLDGWHDENQLERFRTSLGDRATAMLFRCTGRETHLTSADAS